MRRTRTVSLVLVGLASAAALALGTTGALSGFTAAIANTNDTITTGSLSMQEDQLATVGGSVIAGKTCNSVPGSTTSCTSINKFGGSTAAKPGQTFATVVRLTNTGTVSASTFTLTPGGCSQNPTTGTGVDTSFCGKVRITIEDDTATPTCVVGTGTNGCTSGGDTDGVSLTAFDTSYSTTPLALTAPVAASGARTYTITAWVVSTANNTDQGIQASDSLTWTFNS